MSRAGKAGGAKDLLVLVAMNHLAVLLFVALSIQDAEPELLAHQAVKCMSPRKYRVKRWLETFLPLLLQWLIKDCA